MRHGVEGREAQEARVEGEGGKRGGAGDEGEGRAGGAVHRDEVDVSIARGQERGRHSR